MPSPLSIAMSTSWSVRRGPALGPVLDAIQELGFRRIELNSLTPGMVAELGDELARRDMVVQSIHSPCPWPVDAAGERLSWTGLSELSSPDGAERGQAMARSKGTIELARHLGARAVIMHLGHIETSVSQPQLLQLLRAGRQEEFLALRHCALVEREAAKAPFLECALASIRELGACAAEAGVLLGVETRDGYFEIPSLAELEEVFAATEGLPVHYWHDVGHAERQRHLGLADPEAYLRSYRSRLIGVHLHDTIFDRDHLAPGMGETDLGAVARLLPEGVLRTLELSDVPTPEEVRRGTDLLRGLGLA